MTGEKIKQIAGMMYDKLIQDSYSLEDKWNIINQFSVGSYTNAPIYQGIIQVYATQLEHIQTVHLTGSQTDPNLAGVYFLFL